MPAAHAGTSTFSSTVRSGINRRSSGMYPMPSRARACVGTLARSRPSSRTEPRPDLSSPIIVFMTVVLPAPLRPMRPVIEPAGTWSDTSRRICIAAIETLRCWISSTLAHHVALHLRIGERGLRRRVGDDAAVVEGEHALREAADDLHVVLDEKHSGAFGAHRVEHHLHDPELLLRRHAAGRLVEQQDARPRDHGKRDVEKLARAAGEDLRVAAAVVAQSELTEEVLRHLVRRPPVARNRRRAAREEAGKTRVSQDDAQAYHHVLEHRKRAVELRDLERAADPEARDLARRQAGDVSPFVGDAAPDRK